MRINSIPAQDIPYFSNRDKAYYANQKELMDFVKYPDNMEGIMEAMKNRSEFPVNREVLVTTLEKQYAEIETSQKVLGNIQSLRNDNTFTVVTAHQPSLFTGPFYFILKICSAIRLANELNKVQDKNKVVPLFIVGGEDHDFEEINHTYLFGNKLTWEREASGPVGRLDFTNFEDSAYQALFDILGNSETANHVKELFSEAFQSSKNYGEFTFRLVDSIFAEYGLVCMSFDEKEIKSACTELIKKEIFHQASKPLVEKTQNDIKEIGFDSQAYTRRVNFFYLHFGKRDRISPEGDGFTVVDSDIKFSAEEIEREIDNHPERFSPNVIMRPVFQETILPNLAYIGGGGELAYWMERMTQFEEFGIFYPVLLRRNSAMYVSDRQYKMLEEFDLDILELTGDIEYFLKSYAKDHSDHELDLSDIYKEFDNTFEKLLEKVLPIDGSLQGRIAANQAGLQKDINKLEDRLLKKMKQNQENKLNKIRKLSEQLFPNNGLQERYSNFLEFYLKEGSDLIPYLVEQMNPLDKDFKVIIGE